MKTMLLGVLKVEEDYDTMKTELNDIIKEVERLKTTTYQDIEYQTDWYILLTEWNLHKIMM